MGPLVPTNSCTHLFPAEPEGDERGAGGNSGEDEGKEGRKGEAGRTEKPPTQK